VPTGFQPGRVAAGGQLGQHPFQGERVQQLGAGECLPGRDGDLAGAVSGADPRPVDAHAAAAEGDLAGLGGVAGRGPGGLVAAPWADQLVDVGGQQRVQYLDAGARGQREQPLVGGAGQLPRRNRDLLGQGQIGVGGHGWMRILSARRSPSVELLGGCPTPTTRQAQAGTATSTSTGSGSAPRTLEVMHT
jgi:hypothetical protein